MNHHVVEHHTTTYERRHLRNHAPEGSAAFVVLVLLVTRTYAIDEGWSEDSTTPSSLELPTLRTAY
jgi:hypothetical protein